MSQQPQPSQFAQNAGVGGSIATSAAVTLWAFRCLTQHQLVQPDETVAIVLSGYFFPVGIALRDFLLSFIHRETAVVEESPTAKKD